MNHFTTRLCITLLGSYTFGVEMDINVAEVASVVYRVGVGLGIGGIVAYTRGIRRSIEWNGMKVESMDFAMEKSFKNGYAGYRDEKMEKLIAKNKYVKGEK